MKLRIGYGPGIGHASTSAVWFADFVDGLEELGFDSLWLPERLAGPSTDPVVGLAFAAARTTRLKLGTSVLVLPGRNPVVLAKELASLDALSAGRFLPAFGLGVADAIEQSAFGLERSERASIFDEALDVMRQAWSGQPVEHDGEHFRVHGFKLAVLPVQPVLEVWLGGIAPSELRRVGRLADGWLPSFVSPEEASQAREVVEEASARAGRSIDREHFGALIPFTLDQIPERFRTFLQNRRPGTDPSKVVAEGVTALKDLIERFFDRGFSKFVLTPLFASGDGRKEMELLAEQILPMQN